MNQVWQALNKNVSRKLMGTPTCNKNIDLPPYGLHIHSWYSAKLAIDTNSMN